MRHDRPLVQHRALIDQLATWLIEQARAVQILRIDVHMFRFRVAEAGPQRRAGLAGHVLQMGDIQAELLLKQELPQGLPGVQIQERKSEKPTSWRVVLPPQGSAAAANRRLDSLQQAGVDDAFVIRDPGPLQWGISLGLFRSEESAEKRLAELRSKNVKGAQIVTRTVPVIELSYQCPPSVAGDLRRRIQARFPQLSIDACHP